MFLKKLLICLSSLVFAFGMISLVYAEKSNESLQYGDIEIISDTTVLNTQTGENYTFDNRDDRNEFFSSLESKDISLYACIPGDPGYPNCNSNPVVRVDSIVAGPSYNTPWILSNNYLLTESGWVGEGDTMSISKGFHVPFNISDIGSFGYTITTGVSFPVPLGKMGNIKYEACFTITPNQWIYYYQDGSKAYGSYYKVSKFAQGRYVAIYKNM